MSRSSGAAPAPPDRPKTGEAARATGFEGVAAAVAVETPTSPDRAQLRALIDLADSFAQQGGEAPRAVEQAVAQGLYDIKARFQHTFARAHERDTHLDPLVLGFGPLFPPEENAKMIANFKAEHPNSYGPYEASAATLAQLWPVAARVVARAPEDSLARLVAAKVLAQVGNAGETEQAQRELKAALVSLARGEPSFLSVLPLVAKELRRPHLLAQAQRVVSIAVTSRCLELLADRAAPLEARQQEAFALLDGLAGCSELFLIPDDKMKSMVGSLKALLIADDEEEIRRAGQLLAADASSMAEESAKFFFGMGQAIAVPLIADVPGADKRGTEGRIKAAHEVLSASMTVVKLLQRGSGLLRRVLERLPLAQGAGVGSVLGLASGAMREKEVYEQHLWWELASQSVGLALGAAGTVAMGSAMVGAPALALPGAVAMGLGFAKTGFDYEVGKYRGRENASDARAFLQGSSLHPRLIELFCHVDTRGRNIGFFITQVAPHLEMAPHELLAHLGKLRKDQVEKFIKVSKMQMDEHFQYADDEDPSFSFVLHHPVDLAAAAKWLKENDVLKVPA